MERVFGLTQQKKEDRYFAMYPEEGESSPAFVMRVERYRKAWQMSA